MGMGDELMAAGRAQRLAMYTDPLKRVLILSCDGAPRWSELWRGNPHIAQPDDMAELGKTMLIDGPGCRPYIQRVEHGRFIWKPNNGGPVPAMMVLTPEEDDYARQFEGHLIVGIKPKADVVSENKEWPAEYWGEVIDKLGPYTIPVSQPLTVPNGIRAPSMRHAVAMLKYSRGYLGIEGGMHHAAAAFGKPAVVIMGGYVGPSQTGYALPNHRYLTGGVMPCGSMRKCGHCQSAMREITPDKVMGAYDEVINVAHA